MDKITEFSSQRQYPDMPSVDDIAKALTVNLEVAENLFSKRAKVSMQKALEGSGPKISESGDQLCPAWVVQSSVTINLLMSGRVRDKAVDRAIHRVIDAVLTESETLQLRPVLLSALHTRIHPIGGDTFNMVVKQKFAVGADSEDEMKHKLFGEDDG